MERCKTFVVLLLVVGKVFLAVASSQAGVLSAETNATGGEAAATRGVVMSSAEAASIPFPQSWVCARACVWYVRVGELYK